MATKYKVNWKYRVVKSMKNMQGKWFALPGTGYADFTAADAQAAKFAAQQAALNISPAIISVRNRRRTLVEYKLEGVPAQVRRVDWTFE